MPQELIAEIDAVVGSRGRSAFLVETARAELRRRKLLAFLQDDQPAWTERDHPGLAAGTVLWVQGMRLAGEKRIFLSRRKARKSK